MTDRDQDHQAAHGGRALLLLMGFRPVAADRLALALLGLQPADQCREEHEADDRCGQNRPAGPKRDVSEQIEDDKIICQREQQVIEHLIIASTLLDGASRLAVSVVRSSKWRPNWRYRPSAESASTTTPILLPAEPLTMTTSPPRIASAICGASALASSAQPPRRCAGQLVEQALHVGTAAEHEVGAVGLHRFGQGGMQQRRPLAQFQHVAQRRDAPAAGRRIAGLQHLEGWLPWKPGWRCSSRR